MIRKLKLAFCRGMESIEGRGPRKAAKVRHFALQTNLRQLWVVYFL